MLSNQIIQNCITELTEITKVELAVYSPEGNLIAASGEAANTDGELVRSFQASLADTQQINQLCFMRVKEESSDIYILTASCEQETAYMIAKIAVSQIQTLLVAYREKHDRNHFFQNLVLDNLLLVDIYNYARKLRIEVEAQRIVYLIETKVERESGVIETLQSMFSRQQGDYVTAVDEKNVVLIKSINGTETPEELHQTAQTIVDMMNMEVMLKVRVSYGTIVSELKDISKSYKEAKMALDVGRIFYEEKRVMAYSKLGIGRLIYQLPVSLCRMFMNEIFGENIPKQTDEETLNTIHKFFENSLNISETSRQLYIHRNTLIYRIERLQKETGLDVRYFDDALTFKIALMVVKYLNYIDKQDF